jgi:hypothetical protein
MTELDPVLSQDLAHKQPAMALVRLGLAAKQCDPTLPAIVRQPLNGELERGLLGHAVVASMAVLVVMILPRWPTAELLAGEEIADARFAESLIQVLAVELRSEARVGI